MKSPKLHLKRVLHGGDYNPEQWPAEIWDEDVRLMREAHVNVATLPVFGWSALQPDENVFTFEWLDRVIEKLHAAGIKLCLATPTASMPPWMAHKYPQTQRADKDAHRIRRPLGNRQNTCPNSSDFRRLTMAIARKMAERYGKHPALVLWHVSNEYSAPCYCETCAAEFRAWLERRYGTIDELNDRWYSSFWGQRYTAWEQIDPPYHNGQGPLQALRVDYDRFQSDSMLQCYLAEKTVLREITPDVPITTNMMGFFKPLDYHKWARDVDVVSWDSYPRYDATPADIAFSHSLMRGAKEGEPWLLLEQTPSQQNWAPYNSLKRPGVMRLWSYQAMAHGSDAVMYFQWRRSRGGIEKLHGAVVSHEGSSRPRVFQEVAQLGRELESLGNQTIGGRVRAEAALLFDWESWWAMEYSAGPSVDLKYRAQAASFFTALHASHITTDVLSPEADLWRYKLIVVPMLYMVKPGVAERLEQWVRAGGTLVVSYFSGIVDETDRVHLGGYPGLLRKLTGVWVEEIDPLPPQRSNRVVFAKSFGKLCGDYNCTLLCERILPESAEVLATYASDFYAGEAAITRNRFGSGTVYYIGTALDPATLRLLMAAIARQAGVAPVLPDLPDGIEATVRMSPGGSPLLYLLNHNDAAVRVHLAEGHHCDLLDGSDCSREVEMPPYGVRICAAIDDAMITLKNIVVTVLAVTAAAILAFGPRGTEALPQDRVIVDYWEKWNGSEERQMRTIVDDFNNTVGREKKIFVRYISTSMIDQKTLVATAAGVPPDIAGVWDNTLVQYASLDALEPLEDLARDAGITAQTYKPAYWKGCNYRGHLYALVSTPGVVAMLYNREMFEQSAPQLRSAGLDPNRPPRTLAELDAYAKALDKFDGSGRLIRAGYFPLEPGWYLPYTAYWFGGSIFDESSQRFTLTDPKVVAAYTWIQSYSKKLGATRAFDFRSGFGNFDSPQNPFLAGTVAMEQQGPWMANYIDHLRPDRNRLLWDKETEMTKPLVERKKNYSWAVAAFPSAVEGLDDVTYCTGDIMVIPRGARHKAEAFTFMAYVNRQDVMEKLCKLHCKNSPLAKVSDDFLNHHPNPYIDVFERLAASPNARPAPQVPILTEVVDELNNATQRIALLRGDVLPTLTEAQNRLQGKFDEFNAKQRERLALQK